MQIRPFRTGDEIALLAVFRSAIHGLASKNYTPEQVRAWAPQDMDQRLWADRMRGIQPFVVEAPSEIAAYADIQPSGYIDHFFVAPAYARQGVGSMLMEHIHKAAREQEIRTLTSDVSLTAQPFFEKFGFVIVEKRSPVIRGVVVPMPLCAKSWRLTLPSRGRRPASRATPLMSNVRHRKLMSAGFFALLFVLVPLGLAAVPAVAALRTRTLFAADIGLIFLPAPAFLAALLAFNEPAQTGWAGIAYPFLVFWACVLVFYLRVFAMPRLGLSARSAAIGTLVVVLLAAALFGALVPPFYE